jgi:hypothetical protein
MFNYSPVPQSLRFYGRLAAVYHLSNVQALDESCACPTGQLFSINYQAHSQLTPRQGLMFKVGIFMGWSDLSIDGTVPWHVLVPLYLGCCLWTITYETVYQHQVGSVSGTLFATDSSVSPGQNRRRKDWH